MSKMTLSKMTRQEKKALQQKLKVQNALTTMKNTLATLRKRNADLTQRAAQLDRSIMENLSKGNEFEAGLDCAAMKQTREHSQINSRVAQIVNNKMIQVEQQVAVGEAASALSMVNSMDLGNPVDIEAFLRGEENNTLNALLQDALSNMHQDSEVAEMLEQYKRRLAQCTPDVPVPPSPVGQAINSTSKLAG